MNTYEMMISGRVQGVGFRFHAQQIALQLELNGNVRNLTNGNVKIILQCTEQELNSFIQYLKVVPHRFMNILNIDYTIIPTIKEYHSFSIVNY